MASQYNMKGFVTKSRPASGMPGGAKGKGKKGASGSMLKDSSFKTYKQAAPSSSHKLPKGARKR